MSLIAFGCICLNLHSLHLRVKLFSSYVTDAESSVVQWFLHQLELILLIFYGCVSNYTCSQKKKKMGEGKQWGKKSPFNFLRMKLLTVTKHLLREQNKQNLFLSGGCILPSSSFLWSSHWTIEVNSPQSSNNHPRKELDNPNRKDNSIKQSRLTIKKPSWEH